MQWKCTAGPRQRKATDQALSNLRRHGQSHVEVTDHGEHALWSPLSPVSSDIALAIKTIGDAVDWTITPENRQSIIDACDVAIKSIPMPRVDKRRTPEQKAADEAQRAANEAKRVQEGTAKKLATDKHVEELRAKYPWHKDCKPDLSDYAKAAWSIKKELTLAFPGINFSVTSESFSMGNSVRVAWSDGPTTAQVGEITSKYKSGSFDGMVDMYEYDSSAFHAAVEIVLGDAKYVSDNRNISIATTDEIAKLYCQAFGIEYNDGWKKHVTPQGTLSEVVWRVGMATSFPAKFKITGLKESTSTLYPYDLIVDQAGPATASASGISCHVEKHRHTKKNFDMWLVVLDTRIERPMFDQLRSRCIAEGGWYSRQWGRTPGGFAFDNEDAAVKYAAGV